MTNIDMIDLFYDKCEDCNVTSYADDKTPYSLFCIRITGHTCARVSFLKKLQA